MIFAESDLKVQRAKKHIEEIHDVTLRRFVESNFYDIVIDKHTEGPTTVNRIEVRRTKSFPVAEVAIVIGDVLHNLRSALDILWYQTVIKSGGTPSSHTRFPIEDTREKLEPKVAEALKQKRISSDIRDCVVEDIQPYKAGNFAIWALHEMNIWDKHQLLVPMIELMRILNVRFKDNKGSSFAMNFDFHGGTMTPAVLHTMSWEGATYQVEDKGHPAMTIRFDKGFPFENEPVTPALAGIAEEVSCTIEAFRSLLE